MPQIIMYESSNNSSSPEIYPILVKQKLARQVFYSVLLFPGSFIVIFVKLHCAAWLLFFFCFFYRIAICDNLFDFILETSVLRRDFDSFSRHQTIVLEFLSTDHESRYRATLSIVLPNSLIFFLTG